MRVLLVADIHGNREALEAIREPFDACICVGDIVDYGPEPAACVQWVRENATYRRAATTITASRRTSRSRVSAASATSRRSRDRFPSRA